MKRKAGFIPEEFSQLNLPTKKVEKECIEELNKVCKKLCLKFGDFAFKVILAVYWEGKKRGLKEGQMAALDFTLILYGANNRDEAINKIKEEINKI